MALDRVSCPAVSEAAVRRVIAVEIGTLLLDAAAPNSDHAAIWCEGDVVHVEARGPAPARPVDRAFRLGEFPADAAARALGLAAIEMVAALNPAFRQHVEALTHPPPPRTPRPTAEPSLAGHGARSEGGPPVRPALFQATVSGTRRMFLSSGGSSLWGAALALDASTGSGWAVGTDLELGETRATVPLGEASGLLASTSAYFGARGAWSDVTGILALGGRLGLARLSGNPPPASDVVGRSVVRPWAGPTLAVRLLGGIGHLGLQAGAEFGYALVGADGTADAARALSVRGPWVACSLGVGLRR